MINIPFLPHWRNCLQVRVWLRLPSECVSILRGTWACNTEGGIENACGATKCTASHTVAVHVFLDASSAHKWRCLTPHGFVIPAGFSRMAETAPVYRTTRLTTINPTAAETEDMSFYYTLVCAGVLSSVF